LTYLQENSIPVKLARLGDGRVVPRREAQRAFATEHRARHGALAPAVAEVLLGYNPSSLLVGVWFARGLDTTYVERDFPELKFSISSVAPVGVVEASPEALANLAIHPGVSLIELAPREMVGFQASSVSYANDGAADYSQGRDYFNAKGFHAATSTVGIDDVMTAGYTIREDHEAFAFNASKFKYYESAPGTPSTLQVRR